MTARRSRFGRSAALSLLALVACASHPRYPLERPPSSPDLVGRLAFYTARAADTFVDLAPVLGVGYVELVAANLGVDPWLPKGGTRLVVPRPRLLPSGPREGIVVNLGDLRLYFFEPGKPPRSFPIGIAKDGYATPLGVTTVTSKREKPIWTPGPTARRDGYPERVEPGPDNPLGDHALYLDWPGYLIHGTNDARGVGRHSSRGCIRLYPQDMAWLYARVEPGAKVRVVNEPVKLGWVGRDLYLEVNPDAEQSLELDETAKCSCTRAPKDLRAMVLDAAGKHAARLDWPRIERAALRRSGVPTLILVPPGAARGIGESGQLASCSSCRGWLGAPIHAGALFPTPKVNVRKGADQLRTFKKTEASPSQLCVSCGAPVLVRHPAIGMTDIPAGTIRGLAFKPTLHVHYGEKVRAVRDGLPKFKDFPKDFGGSGRRWGSSGRRRELALTRLRG